MQKFKKGDKVVFIEEHHSPDYIRDYIPLIGSIGVIQYFSKVFNEYVVLFENANAITYCYEDEIELVKPKEPITTINDNGINIKATIKDGFRITDLYPNMIKTEYYDRYVKGEWDNMNKVLELWYARKHDKIMKDYEEKEREFNKSKELVIKYKEIIERFENELEELYNCEENIEKNYISDNNLSESMYKYKINYDKLKDEFLENYVVERDKKLNELDKLKEEIDAQLSLSSELDYQIEVLTTYGILDKKTKKMVD